MGRQISLLGRATLVAAAVLGLVAVTPALAQQAERVEVTEDGQRVEVTSGGERIVVDGNTVRVEGADGSVTEVSGDWRSAGAVYVDGDTEAILVELGAVTVEDRIQLNLAGDILFDFDSSAILPAAAAQLAKVAHVIRQRAAGQVYVIGHTDSIGEEEYNLALSRQRAGAVMHWLSRNEAIPASLMVGSGLGTARPVAHNTNPDGSDYPAGRARNRRVEIQIATREGVRVGPEVVIGPGGVRVTEDTVEVGGGAIRVEPGRVQVGGVEVTPGGVRVGGVTVGGEGSGVEHGASRRRRMVNDEAPSVCAGGQRCAFGCPGGDCVMTCAGGADCDFSCAGGDCNMTCAGGAGCDFSCTGGDCHFHCAAGSDCRSLGCLGGDCRCSGPGC